MTDAIMDDVQLSFALCPEQQAQWEVFEQATTWEQAARQGRVEIDGELNLARLRQAWQALPSRHPALGARIKPVVGFHGVRYCPGVQTPPALVVVEAHEPHSQRLDAWRQREFCAASGSWAEALLLHLGERQWRLVIGVACCLVDDASLPLLMQGLIELYEAADADAPEDNASFEQYLEWRAETVIDEDAAAGEGYWREHLRGALRPTGLPWRLGNARGGTVRRLRMALTSDVQVGLQRQGRACGIAPEMLMQAAWWALLSRVMGQTKFLGAWRHDGRGDYEYFEQCAGVLEKSLPLAIELNPEQSFSTWAASLKATLEHHADWQEYWSARLSAETSPYGFAIVREPEAVRMGSASWKLTDLPSTQHRFELLLQVQGGASAAGQVWLDFLPDCYPQQGMERLLEQYRALLDDIIGDATTALEHMHLASAAEQALALALNPPHEDSPVPSLVQRIERWFQEIPDHCAVVCGAQRLTYAQLAQQVSRLAGRLTEQGVATGDYVAIALPRSADWLVAALAIWRVGAAYVPLDPQWPVARQLTVAQQAGVAVVVGRTEVGALFQAEELLIIDPATPIDALNEPLQPLPALDADQAAYVLFTSGSTGAPKGVVVEHRQLAGYLAGVSETLDLQQCAHFACTSSVAADLGHTTLFGSLYNGACLHIADDETVRAPQRFAAYLAGAPIDCLKIVPSHLAALLDVEHPTLPGTVILGGEPPAPSLIERILTIRPDCRLFNHYGPTEATVGVMVQALSLAHVGLAPIALGRVLPGNQVYVLDSYRRLVPAGVQGELFIGGRQLSRGYLDSTLQAQAFIASPFHSGERLYRTGDLASYRLDGSVVLQGRKDQQVKVNGYRIELGEIEAELLSQQGVKEAGVVNAGTREAAQPVAFVVLAAAWPGAPEALREALSRRLPAAALPRRIEVLEGLPRLANGKVDRGALTQCALLEREEHQAAPRNALETLLMKRMAMLLGRETLSIHQDFFAAGGHSLLVIKLAAGLRKLLRRDVSPAVIFDSPSVATLAQALRDLPDVDEQQLEATARVTLQLEGLSPAQRAALEEQARQRRNQGE